MSVISNEHLRRKIERDLRTCVHFNGIQHVKCKANVPYSEFDGKGLPCASFAGKKPPDLCRIREYPTREQAEAEAIEWEQSVERTMRARISAKDDAKAKGLKKGSGGRGSVPCSACGSGTLHYSVASYNGHMHGKCSTQGCVSWME